MLINVEILLNYFQGEKFINVSLRKCIKFGYVKGTRDASCCFNQTSVQENKGKITNHLLDSCFQIDLFLCLI